MLNVTCAHTADIAPAVLAEARRLLADVFAEDFGDDDWEHALGGMHALVWDSSAPGRLIGHGSVVQRRLIHGGHALRCGYVEGVGVHPGWRRRGVGSALMAPLERIVRSAYDVGALGSTDDGVPFYVGRGWRAWPGSAWALTPDGRVRSADEEGCIYLLDGTTHIDLDDAGAELTCDWRDGDVW